MEDVETARKRRAELKRRYCVAFERASKILFTEDPVGINFEENTDEYEPEVGTILPRLHACQSVDDVQKVVHEEFVKWFDDSIAGPLDRYGAVASRIWAEVVPELTK